MSADERDDKGPHLVPDVLPDGLHTFPSESVLEFDAVIARDEAIDVEEEMPRGSELRLPAVRVPRWREVAQAETTSLWWMLAAGLVVLALGVYELRITNEAAPSALDSSPGRTLRTASVERSMTAPPGSARIAEPPRYDDSLPALPARTRPPAGKPAPSKPAPSPSTRVTPPAAPTVLRTASAQPALTPSSLPVERISDEDPIPVPPRVDPPAVAAKAAASSPPAPSPRSLDRAAIEHVLQEYRDSYSRLDAPSAALVWPRVDTRALSRAFSSLVSQDVTFDRCDLSILGPRATARCVGRIEYVQRIGDQFSQTKRVSWSFALERVADQWQIAQVTAD